MDDPLRVHVRGSKVTHLARIEPDGPSSGLTLCGYVYAKIVVKATAVSSVCRRCKHALKAAA